ncbi:MerR family transcriptional regulator [Billgrantia saliphila]|uniref:MerR family transcriptional regulator n=1 Tax=Billgrantia saliphila TaxID=1848458 RepID=UPI000CE313E6|nr:MerR family transcriptional regulator [Halomonas saliphila]
MLLRIGELAKRSGLTIRTLHHYDDIGLLVPSTRSEAGYRLYSRRDIARLHRIQALRSLGVSLADIGDLLDRPEPPLANIVERQIGMLEERIAQQTRLLDRLQRLHRQFVDTEEPDLTEWLNTLELMTMYDRYFSRDELDRLPLYQVEATQQPAWREMIEAAEALLARNVSPQDPKAQTLAARWMAQLERDTAADPTLFDKLNAMHANEPAAQQQLGVSPQVTEYMTRAFAESKLAIYRRHLSDAEFAHMREHYPRCLPEWPPLIAELRQRLDQGIAPEAPEVQRLARRWLELLRRFAGDDPATHSKIRQANAQEPALREGTWLDERLEAYLGQAIAHLTAA